MQPSRRFVEILSSLADRDHYLFTLRDMSAAMPECSNEVFKVMVSRATRNGSLRRLCRNLYLYEKVDYPRDLVLYHAAARLRAHCFTYLSLETVLSDAGVISQIPLNWITLMSSGREGLIECTGFGTIEFIHTERKPSQAAPELSWDFRCRLWRATPRLALVDMRTTRRPLDLVDMDALNEPL